MSNSHGADNVLVLFLSNGFIIVADAIVLILTWIKTFHLWREGRRLDMRLPISTWLLRDGELLLLALKSRS